MRTAFNFMIICCASGFGSRQPPLALAPESADYSGNVPEDGLRNSRLILPRRLFLRLFRMEPFSDLVQ